MSLADFKGKTILVNLWATWCVPCREEMPALDKLQAEFGGPDFEVVAINVDTRNRDKPKAWLQENGIRNLAYHADPDGQAAAGAAEIRPCGRPADHLRGRRLGLRDRAAERAGRMGLAGCGRASSRTAVRPLTGS